MPRHVDSNDEHRHLRLNALVTRPESGGLLRLADTPLPLAPGEAIVFRSDMVPHEVTPVSGLRIVWSVGCLY